MSSADMQQIFEAYNDSLSMGPESGSVQINLLHHPSGKEMAPSFKWSVKSATKLKEGGSISVGDTGYDIHKMEQDGNEITLYVSVAYKHDTPADRGRYYRGD
jgi:hypothetical protein